MTRDTVLIVAGGQLQEPAVQAAKGLGYRVAMTDRDPGCYCRPLVDEFYPIDIYDVYDHIALAKRKGSRWAAVFTAAADPVSVVAMTARAAGLHGVHPAIAAQCQDKLVLAFRLRGLGLAPQFEQCQSIGEVKAVVRKFTVSQVRQRPGAIIKAPRGSGGRGHTFVEEPSGVTPEACARALGGAKGGAVLVQRRIYGLELSAEAAWYEGEMVPLNAVERPFAHRPADLCHHTNLQREDVERLWADALPFAGAHAIEMGHLNPAMLSGEQWDEVWRVMEEAGMALGLDEQRGGHILKGDLILEDGSERAYVLELTLRLSGNWDSGATSPLAHGVDYTRAALKMALGQEPDWRLLSPSQYRHAACLFSFQPPGQVREARRPVRCFDGEVRLRYQEGDAIPEMDGYSSLAAWCIGHGPTRAAAVGEALIGLEGVRFEIE